jgi:hypothetical protein
MPEDCANEPGRAVVSITVGVDGRLYCHDISPGLVEVLAAVCGDDHQLVIRLESSDSFEDDTL